MKRPIWLDHSISFRGDTPDSKKGTTLVYIDINTRDKKSLGYLVEIDFIRHPSHPDAGGWAYIENISKCCGDQLCNQNNDLAFRGNWAQFNFKSAKSAFRFAEQTLLFIKELHASGVGLVPCHGKDPRDDLYMKAQDAFHRLEAQAKVRRYSTSKPGIESVEVQS